MHAGKTGTSNRTVIDNHLNGHMDHRKLKILTWHDSGFISIHEGYDLIHLCFNNLLLNFTLKEFCAFRRMTKALLVDECRIPFPDGSNKVIPHTPYEGINFSFDPREIRDLVDALDEAYYMQKIHTFLSDN